MATNPDEPPIDGHIHVDPVVLISGGGGLVTHNARDDRGGEPIMAVRVPDGESPRAAALGRLTKTQIAFCLAPLAHGIARDDRGKVAQFVICPAAAGPPLELNGRGAWGEDELLETLLRPVAAALDALAGLHVTHRAIRADNVFQAARGQKVTLGCAWACAPASRQPAFYEPPYSAICAPAARGDGAIADDVYALGVLMVALASGHVPLTGLNDAALVARKLSLGSAEAVLGEARLSPIISDLARSMLAADPEHRPTPASLLDPSAARGRRTPARSARRASRPFEVGARTAWDARSLALALGLDPLHATGLLLGGSPDAWLRRVVGDAPAAALLEEAVRQRNAETILDDADADAILLARAVAVLDPLAPMCWLGRFLWPDALGAVLIDAPAAEAASLVRLIRSHAVATWAAARPQRCDPARLQAEVRQVDGLLRQPGWAGGLARLRYALNPMLPCRSARVDGSVVLRIPVLLALLEDEAARPDRPTLPLDAELAAFVAARSGVRMDAEFATMARADANACEKALAQLRLLTKLQGRIPSALPGLAKWLSTACAPVVAAIRNRARRSQCEMDIKQQVASGRLSLVLGVLDDPAAAEADRHEAVQAAAVITRLGDEIAVSRAKLHSARARSRRVGHEIVASAGLIAVAAAIVLATL